MKQRVTTTSRRKPPEPASVRIDRVGSEGDGIARLPDGTPLYLPFTLPGETVTARALQSRGDGWHAFAEAISRPGEARVKPPCRHFGRCGGCALQHWRDEDYRAWKSGLLSHALRQAGFLAPDPLDYVAGQPSERRRIDFAVRRAAGRIILGLHRQRSSEVIDLTECLVLHPSADGPDGAVACAVARAAGSPAGGIGRHQSAGVRPRHAAPNGHRADAGGSGGADRVRCCAWLIAGIPGAGQRRAGDNRAAASRYHGAVRRSRSGRRPGRFCKPRRRASERSSRRCGGGCRRRSPAGRGSPNSMPGAGH